MHKESLYYTHQNTVHMYQHQKFQLLQLTVPAGLQVLWPEPTRSCMTELCYISSQYYTETIRLLYVE